MLGRVVCTFLILQIGLKDGDTLFLRRDDGDTELETVSDDEDDPTMMMVIDDEANLNENGIAAQNKENGTYTPLIVSCPSCGDKHASHWKHGGDCCGETEMNEFGFVRCASNHGAPFMRWKWECDGCRGDGGFKQTNREYLSFSLKHLVQKLENNDFSWFVALINNISD